MCTPNARLGSCVFLRCVAPCVKPENRHCRGESEGGLPSSRTDGGGGVGGGWEIFPGAPCVCWLLFQTISTSLIILIRHFYTWIPLFRIFLFFFFFFPSLAVSSTEGVAEITQARYFHGLEIWIFTLF